ncbi:regulator [Streptomyces deccanensis]|uniref:regulator n=1 Tax=Streptomyces deccanensis TaxID=424188 RepID=UPI001EFB1F13|nr:regulator [Streptomyces deccanensis]ULR48451.1 regulator [Streptomyces deccanensis]
MTTSFTAAGVRNAVELLASRSLIRLVTEIDENGAIPPRRLAGTLPDLSSRQLRHALETAHAHGLVRTAPGAGLELTESGSELADLYDAVARWGRRHAYPERDCEFSARICSVLGLLGPSLAAEHAEGFSRRSAARPPSNECEADPARPRALLLQWLAGNPQFTRVAEPELVV